MDDTPKKPKWNRRAPVQISFRCTSDNQVDLHLGKSRLDFDGIGEYLIDMGQIGRILGPEVGKMVREFADGLNTTPGVVIAHAVIAYLADKHVRDIVTNGAEELLTEFATTSKGYVEGKALFDLCVQERVKEFKEAQERLQPKAEPAQALQDA